MKKTFAAMTLAEAMQLVPAYRLTPWAISVPPRPLSATMQDYLRRLQAFDLENTEAAKLLLIDALFAEIVPDFPHLKIWKSMPIESDLLIGIADYIFTPDYAYLKTPLLCVAEAKRDDFIQGRAQCIAEMVACRWKNRQDGYETSTLGIVSNGQTWQFYKLTLLDEVFESTSYTLNDLPELLGVLHHVCAECASAIPASPATL